MLKNCRRAEIHDQSHTRLCEARVFCDLSEDLWVSVPHNFRWDACEYFNIVFFDAARGLIHCKCTLSNPQEFSGETYSLLCTVLEVSDAQQFREDVRVPIEIELEISYMVKPTGSPGLPDAFMATTRDISAGGIYLACRHELPEGSVIEFQLDIASKPLSLIASVLRCEPLPPENGVQQYGHGCRYINLNSQIESSLRNFIFRKQLEDRA